VGHRRAVFVGIWRAPGFQRRHVPFQGYGVIGRFSEDIDVTYDVRELIPELVGDGTSIPKTNSQAQKWRAAIDEKLPAWVQDKALAAINKHVEATGVDVKVTARG
jgi:Nucleotidyl transferase AbiEii toxin, Type IV TA system